MSLVSKYIERVETALALANSEQTKLTEKQLIELKGLSSKRIRILLNELIKEDTNYLEVGTFTGSTFVNALYGNKPNSATVIDSFSANDSWEMDMKIDVQYHGMKVKNGLFLMFLENCKRNGIKDFTCIQGDCFNLLFPDKFEIRNVDTYLFDAGHSKEDHTKAITYYLNNLADVFIYIVDDWNDETVREGTRLGFESSFVKIHKEWEIFSEVKMIGKEKHYDPNWWNGYYIAVCEKPFGFFLPEEEPSKELWCSVTDTIGE